MNSNVLQKTMKQVYVKTRTDWRNWLTQNQNETPGIWLVFFRNQSGKLTREYDSSVEEALCFGWIDSIIKKLDNERYVRKFTPRRSGSRWSELNKKRVRKLMKQELMTKSGVARVTEARKSRPPLVLSMPAKRSLSAWPLHSSAVAGSGWFLMERS